MAVKQQVSGPGGNDTQTQSFQSLAEDFSFCGYVASGALSITFQ